MRFPVHWSATGVPNRWATRNWRSVYGPLIAGAIITAGILSQCAALRFGTRPARARSVAITTMIAVAYVVCFCFSMGPLLFVTRIPVWSIPVIAFGTIATVLVWCIVQMKRPGEKPLAPAPGDRLPPALRKAILLDTSTVKLGYEPREAENVPARVDRLAAGLFRSRRHPPSPHFARTVSPARNRALSRTHRAAP
jgi:hypothetical protein